MKELQVINITREKKAVAIEDQRKEKRNISWKIKKLWNEWGLSKEDLFGLLAAVGMMAQLPMIIWIFANTLP